MCSRQTQSLGSASAKVVLSSTDEPTIICDRIFTKAAEQKRKDAFCYSSRSALRTLSQFFALPCAGSPQHISGSSQPTTLSTHICFSNVTGSRMVACAYGQALFRKHPGSAISKRNLLICIHPPTIPHCNARYNLQRFVAQAVHDT